MNDLEEHKHGDEGRGSTHYVCEEILQRDGGKALCCGCTVHECNEQLTSEEKKV